MTHQEFLNQQKYQRTLAALEAASDAVVDAFHAVQEASTEVEKVRHRERLEGYRSRLRQLNEGLDKIGEDLENDYRKVAA